MKKTSNIAIISIFIGSVIFLGISMPQGVFAANNLNVECRVSDTSIEEGDTVEYEADVSGGNSPYEYEWRGAISGDNRTEDKKFNTNGSYSVRVTVTDDDGDEATDECPTVRVEDDNKNNNNDDLQITCNVSDTRVEVGEEVEYRVTIKDGNSPYEYDWDGDISGNDKIETVEYNRVGTYEVEVTVTDDDNDRDTDQCPDVKVTSNGNTNVSSGGTSSSSGQIATISSAYVDSGFRVNYNSVQLGQIPNTGSEDTILNILYILFLFTVSITAVYIYQKGKIQKSYSVKIEEFKNRNKFTQ